MGIDFATRIITLTISFGEWFSRVGLQTAPCTRRWRLEAGETGDLPASDQGVDVIGAFVRIDGFQIAERL